MFWNSMTMLIYNFYLIKFQVLMCNDKILVVKNKNEHTVDNKDAVYWKTYEERALMYDYSGLNVLY